MAVKSIAYDPATNETLISNGEFEEWIDSDRFKEYQQGHHECFENLRQKICYGHITLPEAAQALYDDGVVKYILTGGQVLKLLGLTIFDLPEMKQTRYSVSENGLTLIKHFFDGHVENIDFSSKENLIRYCYENKIAITIADFNTLKKRTL